MSGPTFLKIKQLKLDEYFKPIILKIKKKKYYNNKFKKVLK